MVVLESVKYLSQFKPAVVTIGNFDGVHLGHQSLLSETVEIAKKISGTSVAVTFDPHPVQIIKNNNSPNLITSYQQKQALIKKQGIDVLLCIPFTKKFASITPLEFVQDILINKIGMKVIVIGKDYSFGKDREGNISLLKKYSSQLDFKLVVKKLIKIPTILNNRISSTRIRKMIEKGDIESANKMLGRNYCMKGKVIHGKNRGKKILGFPTANICTNNALYPKEGVYAVAVKYNRQTSNGVANLGYNPTFQNDFLSLEVHILSFHKEIYGEDITIQFIKRLREEIKFNKKSQLEAQIKEDIMKARQYYTNET